MNVMLNGEPTQLDDGTTVARVVADRAPQNRRVAVAVNGAVVPRSAWPATTVEPGDTLEVLAAMVGG